MKKLLLALAVLAALSVGCISLPDGLHVYETNSGCASDGVCPFHDGAPHNFYYAPTREIVVVPGQSLKVWAHEACHAHQHQTILDELHAEPLDLTLHEWYQTSEGQAYLAAIDGHPHASWPAIADHDSALEDFGEACGRYLVNDPRWPLDPVRTAFFDARDFR